MNIYRSMYHAKKPEGIENKKAYIISGGIAGLASAVFLIDDAHMPGKNITIIEKRKYLGGCCDAYENERGYVCPGERELEPTMECFWYLCSKIPSLDDPTRTILDESYDANLDTPIHSECRLLLNQGHIDDTVHDFRMSDELTMKMLEFITTPEEKLENITIEDFFGKGSEFFDSKMWWCFHTMLAFKEYHSALEAKRYLTRFGLGTRIEYLEGILHTKRNENDSVVKPVKKWLDEHGVKFVYDMDVYDLEFTDKNCNTVSAIKIKNKDDIKISKDDFVIVNNGSLMTNARFGDNDTIAETIRDTEDLGLFNIWRNLAKKHEKFGHPDKFLGKIDKTKWMSFFLTVEDYPEFFNRLEEMTGSKRGTGGAVTVKDSGWEFSFMVYDRNYYPDQEEKNRDCLWGDGLYGERIGDYIKKPMAECTGEEILLEFLYHLNMLDIKDEVLKHTYISTCMMPYITSQFMPRDKTDRPKLIPDGCTNLGFIGQFCEMEGDVVFTIETSVKTGLYTTYALTKLEKEPLEVFPSRYDTRYFLERIKKFLGIEGEITKDKLPNINPLLLVKNKSKIEEVLFDAINDIPPFMVMYPGRDKSVATKKSILDPKYPKNSERK